MGWSFVVAAASLNGRDERGVLWCVVEGWIKRGWRFRHPRLRCLRCLRSSNHLQSVRSTQAGCQGGMKCPAFVSNDNLLHGLTKLRRDKRFSLFSQCV